MRKFISIPESRQATGRARGGGAAERVASPEATTTALECHSQPGKHFLVEHTQSAVSGLAHIVLSWTSEIKKTTTARQLLLLLFLGNIIIGLAVDALGMVLEVTESGGGKWAPK